VRLVSRNGRDHTRRFAGIAAAVAKLTARALVLDGEVAIYDERLRSRFDWLREPDADAVATPPTRLGTPDARSSLDPCVL
jgi:ATP-dependent DNA ligase